MRPRVEAVFEISLDGRLSLLSFLEDVALGSGPVSRRDGRASRRWYRDGGSNNIFDGRRRVREIGLTSVHIGFRLFWPDTSFIATLRDYRDG